MPWVQFQASYAGLPSARLVEHGVAGDWSVKDIIAHVTWWKLLRHVAAHHRGRPPRYSVVYGGIDAFNAMMAERKPDLSLSDVLKQQNDTHERLIDLIRNVPEDQFTRETRLTSPAARYLQPLPDPHKR